MSSFYEKKKRRSRRKKRKKKKKKKEKEKISVRKNRDDIESICPYCECKIVKWNFDGHVKSCARAFGFDEAEDKDISKLQQKNVLTRQEKHALRKRGLLDETETQALDDEKKSEPEKPVKKKRKLPKDTPCTLCSRIFTRTSTHSILT